MSDFSSLYTVRDGRPDDVNFILSTFLRGLYHGDSWFSLIPRQIFMDNYAKAAQAILASPNNVVKVACLPDDPTIIIGYSILSADFQTIHWVYVKGKKMPNGDSWRRKGVARSLLPRHPAQVTHLTALGKDLMHKFPNTIFNPFN